MHAPTLRTLAAHAVARSLRRAPTLADAIARAGFVQLDPMRAPARAADLILRHRVAGYRAGDLDRAYPTLPLAEDYMHVYGVLPAATHALLHPRPARYRRGIERDHPRLARRVLDHVATHGATHPRDIAPLLAKVRIVGDWGGDSAAGAHMLQALHHRGQLRVVRRVHGVKIYDVALPAPPALPPAVRARGILHALLNLYSPLPAASLHQLAWMVTDTSLPPALRARALRALDADPAVERMAVDGAVWLRLAHEPLEGDVEARVALLAPFDPVVWDRRRFAAFWGWAVPPGGVHAAREAQVRPLRAAAALARRRDRLGECAARRRRARCRDRLREAGPAQRGVPQRARYRGRAPARMRGRERGAGTRHCRVMRVIRN